MIKLTLGTDSEARKRVPLVAAFLRYIPAAARRFALHSVAGNEKHNKGEPVHHARGKSSDHGECVLRHIVDFNDIEAYIERNGATPDAIKMLLDEVTAEFWRTGIFLQELCEKYEGAPLAPGARLPDRAEINPQGDPDVPKRLPQIVDGAPHGRPWCIVDGDGNLISLHETYVTAEIALDAILGFKPLNTPAEAAELAKAQGTVRLVGMVPELAAGFGSDTSRSYDGGPRWDDAADGAHTLVELFEDGPECRGHGADEPVAQMPDEGAPRCAHMSRTKRVCTLAVSHPWFHSDGIANWGPDA